MLAGFPIQWPSQSLPPEIDDNCCNQGKYSTLEVLNVLLWYVWIEKSRIVPLRYHVCPGDSSAGIIDAKQNTRPHMSRKSICLNFSRLQRPSTQFTVLCRALVTTIWPVRIVERRKQYSRLCMDDQLYFCVLRSSQGFILTVWNIKVA